jgi:hypothetical protein
MTSKEVRQYYSEQLRGCYSLVNYRNFRYSLLKYIMYVKRSGRGDHDSYADCIIMADTETSKSKENEYYIDEKGKRVTKAYENYVVAFTLSIRAYGENVVTLYGNKPSEFIRCLKKLRRYISADKIIIYFHNMSYDWAFLRLFFFEAFGTPTKMLATKPHYPIYIEFANGIILKDSLILAQRGLEKWADDLNVEHKKAVGLWDYNKIRDQCYKFSDEELTYIEHDTLAGVECIDALKNALNKRIYSMPYTATGIPRETVFKIGKENYAKEVFNAIVNPTWIEQAIAESCYHGGYVHANRHFIGVLVENVIAMDFTSSYPYCLLAYKYPMSQFKLWEDGALSPEDIIEVSEDTAFMFKLIMVNVTLKDNHVAMPSLQFSKCAKTINALTDNGRILAANYVEIYINEIDLQVIYSQYKWTGAACTEIYFAQKDYLPRWFTDYVFKCFTDKTMLKGGDKVLYALAKSVVNSLYGMCVQKPLKGDINEFYAYVEDKMGNEFNSGEYQVKEIDLPEAYRKYLKGELSDLDLEDIEKRYSKYVNKKSVVLNYNWGVWCTSYAFRNLFDLGSCFTKDGVWLYSDTDSCYGIGWDMVMVSDYNEKCKKLLKANNYGPVIKDGKEFWLGVVDIEEHKEFKTMGAKRYAVLDSVLNEDTGKYEDQVKITVAGVPKKKGAMCLKSLDDFTEGFIFDGFITGKQTHTYFFINEIKSDEKGNEYGDSIDLSPCDYKLSSVHEFNWEELFEEDVEIQIYDE